MIDAKAKDKLGEQLKSRIDGLSDDDLLDMASSPEDYTEEAIKYANYVLEIRGGEKLLLDRSEEKIKDITAPENAIVVRRTPSSIINKRFDELVQLLVCKLKQEYLYYKVSVDFDKKSKPSAVEKYSKLDAFINLKKGWNEGTVLKLTWGIEEPLFIFFDAYNMSLMSMLFIKGLVFIVSVIALFFIQDIKPGDFGMARNVFGFLFGIPIAFILFVTLRSVIKSKKVKAEEKKLRGQIIKLALSESELLFGKL